MASSIMRSAPASSITLSWRAVTRRGARVLAAIELAVAVPAIPSGIALIRDGMGMRTEWIDHTLLPDYTIPGVLLLAVIGGGMTAAAALTLLRPGLARPLAAAAGVVLLGWLAVETVMIGWHGGPQLALDLVYGGIGAGLVAAGLRTLAVGSHDASR